jgi:hypothetical protein
VQLPVHQLLKSGSSVSFWVFAEYCRRVVGIGTSMLEAGCCEDMMASESSSDGGRRQRRRQVLRESSRRSWFLQQ